MKRCLISFEEVISLENLCEAWEEFIRGKRKKKDVQEFMLQLGDELVSLHQDLASGVYSHGSYEHFSINDPKPREIHKAIVRDRLVHHAVHRKLYPFFARVFIADSFSCQIGKGVHCALDRCQMMGRQVSRNNTRTCWVLKCDIRKFFASIDHKILLKLVRTRVVDERLRSLLQNIVSSFSVSSAKGIPLGNLTSQLFSNVYMNELDQFVKHRLKIRCYIRYGDDFVFLSKNKIELLNVLESVEVFLANKLNLSLHPKKVQLITLAGGVDFLGWTHFPHHRVMRTKTKRRMQKCLGHTSDLQVLSSYIGLLSHGNAHALTEEIQNNWWIQHGCMY